MRAMSGVCVGNAPLGAKVNSQGILPLVRCGKINLARRRCATTACGVAPAKGVQLSGGVLTQGRNPGLFNLTPNGVSQLIVC
jgi:hypothetical protein